MHSDTEQSVMYVISSNHAQSLPDGQDGDISISKSRDVDNQ